MTITMLTEMAEILRQAVAGGEYASTSEVVREALRTAIRARLGSRPAIPADQVSAELRARCAAKASG